MPRKCVNSPKSYLLRVWELTMKSERLNFTPLVKKKAQASFLRDGASGRDKSTSHTLYYAFLRRLNAISCFGDTKKAKTKQQIVISP
jgi:hypothetical protein